MQHQRAQYAGYAQQLYLDTHFYQSQQYTQGGLVYDSEDANYYYITDPTHLGNIDMHGGGIKVVFDKNDSIVYAVWIRPENSTFTDSMLPEEFIYPNRYEE